MITIPFEGYVELVKCEKAHGGDSAIVPYAANGCHPRSLHVDSREGTKAVVDHNARVRDERRKREPVIGSD